MLNGKWDTTFLPLLEVSMWAREKGKEWEEKDERSGRDLRKKKNNLTLQKIIIDDSCKAENCPVT